MKEKLLLTLIAAALMGCGGSGSGSDSNDDTNTPGSASELQTGTFVDSPVANIAYKTSTQPLERTNSAGEFQFAQGDEITFSVGGIELPSAPAKTIVTPLDLADTDDVHNRVVVNIARMLQTLDDDGEPGNGINILDQAHESANGISSASVDFTSDNFGEDQNLVNLWANSGSTTTELVSEAQATEHLSETLAGLSGSFTASELAGNNFYNVFADEEDNNNWPVDDFSFADSGDGVTLNGEPATYSVENGVLIITRQDGETYYIKPLGKVAEGHREVCWADDAGSADDCQSLSVEHFFASEAEADAFAGLQNTGRVNMEGTWKVTESYDVCGDSPTVHYRTTTFDLVAGGLSYNHDYIEDIKIDSNCSAIPNSEETETGVDSDFQGAENLHLTSAELEALLDDEGFHGIVVYSVDRLVMFQEFISGPGAVVVTQEWTRQ